MFSCLQSVKSYLSMPSPPAPLPDNKSLARELVWKSSFCQVQMIPIVVLLLRWEPSPPVLSLYPAAGKGQCGEVTCLRAAEQTVESLDSKLGKLWAK